MAKFRYAAMDSDGGETTGELTAESRTQAAQMIRAKGLFPTRISELDAAGPKKGSVGSALKAGPQQSRKKNAVMAFLTGRVKPRQLMTFTRQLATLIEAGLPLLRGLKILLKQEKTPGLRDALHGMGDAVEGGSTFSESLAQFPRIFDDLFVNMVRAGEAGGVLDQVLLRLAEFSEKAEQIKNKIKSAMIYPVVVLFAAFGILTFLMIFIIPRFEEIFSDLLGDKPLPPITAAVIGFSDFMMNQWYVIIIGAVVLVVSFNLLRKTDKGRYMLDWIKLKAPLFGPLFSKTAVARFTRTLGTLLTSGVPILTALNIVRDTSGNKVLSTAIQKIHDSVKEGDTMAMPLGACGVFPDMVVSMVDVGEETGALPEMLVKIADTYDGEVDNAVEGLTSVIEPIMIIVLAVIVGTIVIAMFVPLISIITEMSSSA